MAGRLFEVPPAEPEPRRTTPAAVVPDDGRVVRVVTDVGAIVREFDYLVPSRWADRIEVGSMVRVPLHGRRVGGWVVALDSRPPEHVVLEALTRWSGIGPPAEVVDLCRWAAWRWAGRLPHFLGAASPDRNVTALPRPRTAPPPSAPAWAVESLAAPRSVVVTGPAQPVTDVVLAALSTGPTLVVCPEHAHVGRLSTALRAAGVTPVVFPDQWEQAAAGAPLVIGTRRAVLAPMPSLGAIVVVDEHDEALQNEGSPTWHVRELAFERGRRRRARVVLTSPAPTLEARRRASVVPAPTELRRDGWAPVVVVDRRDDDRARLGLYSELLVRLVDQVVGRGDRVVCVLNRLGRAGLVSCGSCRNPASCDRCDAAVAMDAERRLVCRQCATIRPPVCHRCGSTSLRLLRTGVSRAREELEALLRVPVGEITGQGWVGERGASVVVGSEAALHQVDRASLVAFLEFDQELLAPRYRAAEQALALLVRAAALVGGRSGRVVVQTQQPNHPVIEAAVTGSADELAELDAARRAMLEVPPAVPLVVMGGPAATDFVAALEARGLPAGWRAEPGPSGNWLLRGGERGPLLDLVAATPRPPGRLRLWVDPARLPV